MGLREETSDGIAGDGSEKDVFFKNGTKLPILVSKVSFWSHFYFEGRNVKVS